MALAFCTNAIVLIYKLHTVIQTQKFLSRSLSFTSATMFRQISGSREKLVSKCLQFFISYVSRQVGRCRL
jgi:hypothetical protein